MVKLYSFSQDWPHIIQMREDVLFFDVLEWADKRADQLGVEARDIYTSFAQYTYAFKDKALAMEFKLYFG